MKKDGLTAILFFIGEIKDYFLKLKLKFRL